MDKRIKNQIRGLGMTVLILTTAFTGGMNRSEKVWGSDTEPEIPCITQTAAWTDKEQGKARLDIGIQGLKEWLDEKYPEEDTEENTEENTGKDVTGDRDKEGGDFGITGMDIVGAIVEDVNTEGEDMEKTESTENAEAAQGDEHAGKETEEELTGEAENEAESEDMLRNPEPETLQERETVTEDNKEGIVQETESVTEVEEPETLEGPEELRELTDGTDRADPAYMEEEETGRRLRCPEQLKVTTVLSRYFQADTEKLPDNCQAEEISWEDKEGEPQSTTKLIFTLDTAGLSGEEHIMVPVTVKEEFRYPALPQEYSLTETEDISGDDGTYGTYLCMEELDGTFILRSADVPALEVEAAEAGLTVTIRAESSLMKAGETLRYKVEVQNTGHLKLDQIKLSSIFSCPKIRQKWKEAEGLTSKGGEALLTQLQEGEKRSFYILAPLENEQERDLTHRVEVTGKVSGRDETLKREVSLTSSLVPLKADFTVKKTADRDTAEPGDKVTYQICIINTGEKTLHSVVGTEQFRQEGIFAYFMEDKGIRLSHDKTKAYIEKIAPGEAISLRASVTIPEKTVSSRLLNRVAVTTLETGSREVSASSEISVRKRAGISSVQQADFTETPVPVSSRETEGENYDMYGEKDIRAVPASTHPKTGDASGKDGYILLLVVACVAGMGAAWFMVHYRRMKADKQAAVPGGRNTEQGGM